LASLREHPDGLRPSPVTREVGDDGSVARPDPAPDPDPGRAGWSAGRRRDRDTRRPEPAPTRRLTGQDADDPGPRKITVTRVAAWRTRNLTRAGVRAFHRAASADGADRSGLTALTYAWMANYASDAALAVALANTLFFSAASAESKDKVALYLLITVAPFALVAPVIGPLLDRVQRGRRWALAISTAGQGVLAVVLALFMDTWALYPAALGILVLSKSFGVLKAAVTPRVLPPGITLVTTNSRLTVFGLVASGVFGGIAAGVSYLAGSPGAAWLTAGICFAGIWLCLRIPRWVEVTEGEMETVLIPRPRTAAEPGRRDRPGARPRVRMSRHVVTALWANGTIRALTGFLTLFAAFVVKAQTEGTPGRQLLLLGVVGAAAGAGGFLGNALGARRRFDRPDLLLITALCAALASTVTAALLVGLATAAVVGLVGATASALLKVCLDAVVQRDMPEAARASAFGRSETILQLTWVFGGTLGVLLPPTWWIGFTVISAVLVIGTVQTVMTSRGRSLLPRRPA
jgi:MFS family permease